LEKRMMSQYYTLVRLERERSLREASGRPSVPRRPRRSLRSLRVRIPRRRRQPLLAPQQYLELEFIVDHRR
jgi:hypothetical protein